MPSKKCGCGREISSFRRSDVCHVCRDEKQRVRAKQNQLVARTAAAKVTGKTLVHSCFYGNGSNDPFVLDRCHCKQLVTAHEAGVLVSDGDAFNFSIEHREYKSYDGTGAIVLKKRFQTPPVSTLAGRIGIERVFINGTSKKPRKEGGTPYPTEASKTYNAKEMAAMRITAQEDREWRHAEMMARIDVENEIAVAEQKKLIKVYSDEAWLELERTFAIHRGFHDGIGHDERTLGGTGITQSQLAMPQDDEIEEQNDQTTIIEPQADEGAEPATTDDIENDIETDCLEDLAEAENEEMAA
jgi:hypothetical protein